MTDYCKVLKTCHQIANAIECAPELRIGQLLEVIAARKNIDLFYMTNEALEKALDEFIEERK